MTPNTKEDVWFVVNVVFTIFCCILFLATFGALTGMIFGLKTFTILCAKVYMFLIFPCAIWSLIKRR